MELRVLRYFLAVAREGSVTRAAASLHISQPTLSKQLKELEEELGKKLFLRSNYSIRLTDEGMLLRKRAEDILDMVSKTEDEFHSMDELIGGDIRIGCAESDGMKYMAQHIKQLQEEYPHIRVHLYSGNMEDVSQQLDRGLLDLAVIVHPADLSRYHYLELPGSDTWGVIMRKDSPLANQETVQIDDLLPLPLICSRQAITEDFPQWFGEKADHLNIVATFNLVNNAGILVQEGVGYALSFDKLVDTSSESELCFRPFSPPLRSSIYLIWKKYQVFTPAAELLLHKIKA